jgi:hypothetical protein
MWRVDHFLSIHGTGLWARQDKFRSSQHRYSVGAPMPPTGGDSLTQLIVILSLPRRSQQLIARRPARDLDAADLLGYARFNNARICHEKKIFKSIWGKT